MDVVDSVGESCCDRESQSQKLSRNDATNATFKDLGVVGVWASLARWDLA
jgi:hypothetical protein